jgi:peptidyl-prolyl cis-trans isomerase B (cyclophilin B)
VTAPVRPFALAAALLLFLTGCITAEPPRDGRAPSPVEPKAHLVFETSKGSFTVRLFHDAAPITALHIQTLAENGFYDGIPFHRYEEGFVIQGGDPTCRDAGLTSRNCGKGGSGRSVPLETNPEYMHEEGAVALARGTDRNSGDSQFYVVLAPQGAHSLDGRYSVFGSVEKGMDAVLKLRRGDVIRTAAAASE